MKEQLRQALRERRRRFVDQGEGQRLQQRLLEHPWFLSAQSVSLYLSIQGEVPTDRILQTAQEMGKTLILPRVLKETRELQLHQWDGRLRPGPFGLLEPPADAPVVEVQTVDLLLVPGLGFDRRGGRLGYGKGHYDRLLQRHRGKTIGVGWDFQILPEVPMEAHDVFLSGILSESYWFEREAGP